MSYHYDNHAHPDCSNPFEDEYIVSSYNHDVSEYRDIHKRRTKRAVGDLLKLFALGACLSGIGTCTYHTSIKEDQATFTINKMEIKRDGDCDRYLIFTDKGVFENTDSLFKFKFNSSDMHNELQPGKTYKATIVGPRIRFLSMYPNVIKAQEVRAPAAALKNDKSR